MDFKERVLDLAAEGRITPEEGELLLRARQGSPWRHLRTLWNPFEALPPRVLLILAVSGLLGSLLLAQAGVRFDGTLDLHFQDSHPGWKPILLDSVLLPSLSAAVLWAAALGPARGTRLRDLWVNLFVARIPQVIISVPFLLVFRAAGGDLLGHMPLIAAMGLAALPFLVWEIALLCLGIRNASGLKGVRLAAVCVGGILAAEIATKVLLFFIH